jgi:hypothetical protein
MLTLLVIAIACDLAIVATLACYIRQQRKQARVRRALMAAIRGKVA